MNRLAEIALMTLGARRLVTLIELIVRLMRRNARAHERHLIEMRSKNGYEEKLDQAIEKARKRVYRTERIIHQLTSIKNEY